jgi:hypothetical protein
LPEPLDEPELQRALRLQARPVKLDGAQRKAAQPAASL